LQAGGKENILKNLNLFAEAAEKIKKAREEIRTADTLLKANLGDFLKIFDNKKDEFIKSLDGLTAVKVAKDIDDLRSIVEKSSNSSHHQNNKKNNNNFGPRSKKPKN